MRTQASSDWLLTIQVGVRRLGGVCENTSQDGLHSATTCMVDDYHPQTQTLSCITQVPSTSSRGRMRKNVEMTGPHRRIVSAFSAREHCMYILYCTVHSTGGNSLNELAQCSSPPLWQQAQRLRNNGNNARRSNACMYSMCIRNNGQKESGKGTGSFSI